MSHRYFITDCQGNPIGNPKGYRTPRGAHQVCESRNSRIKSEIWARFHVYRDSNPGAKLVYRIQALPVSH